MVVAQSVATFQYIHEWEDAFLNLFPHRYDYIWSKRPQLGQKPNWMTESRHPVSDRVLRQGKHLYGVRFGHSTNYLLIDIDIESRYHPRQDSLALHRLIEALETLGLVAYIACSSSYSGGIHLYFPFEQAQSCYQLAAVVTAILESAGFAISPGQLELFPNAKLYTSDGQPNLFSAHRLPLQEPGSYLLNSDWQPVFTSQSVFVQQWKFAQSRNLLDTETFARILKSRVCRSRQISNRASKFLADLDAEIEAGWTGPGQTNHLLGRIALRAYVFHHLLQGGCPLQGQTLVEAIVSTARSLPGFSEWCRHQHELEKKASEWARSVEASEYYPYGYRDQKPQISSTASWNQQQQEAARERIRQAIADLLNKSQLPMGITARRTALVQYGVSHSTLSKHKDLWHPHFLTANSNGEKDQLHPEEQNLSNLNTSESPLEESLHPYPPNKLYTIGADAAQKQSAPENFCVGGSGGFSTGNDIYEERQFVSESEANKSSENLPIEPGPALIRAILNQIASSRKQHKQIQKDKVPPNEEYFRQFQQRGNHDPQTQIPVSNQEDIVELFNTGERFPATDTLLEAIQSELNRLTWTQVQENLWITQHFGEKNRYHLESEELIKLLLQLKQLPSRSQDNF